MQYMFFDLETFSEVDLKIHGVWRYVSHPSTHIVCASFFKPDGSGGVWAPNRYRRPDDGSSDEWLETFRAHVRAGGYVVAWNAQFDRLVVQHACGSLGVDLRLDRVLCAQAQAEAFNVPGKLEKAAEVLKVAKKDPRGKRLISKVLKHGALGLTDAEWLAFMEYVRRDSYAGLRCFQKTRPLTSEEWHDYHVVQRKNDRGVLADIEFAEQAVRWSDIEFESINRDLQRLTGDAEMTVTKHPRKAAYLESCVAGTALHESIFLAVKRKGKKTTSKSAGSAVRDEIRYRLKHMGKDAKVDGNITLELENHLLAFFALLDAGTAVATKKYQKMLDLEDGGRLKAQYVFNGAGQTGREAARGVQLQNVIRGALPAGPGQKDPALDVMDCLCDVGPYASMDRKTRVDMLEKWYGMPFTEILGKCIRPTLIAPEGRALVWGDWSAIEARMLPWLAGTHAAEKKLDVFREGIDPYKMNAASTFGVPYEQVTDEQRQYGKVQELFLGYGGGAGAFRTGAQNFGIRTSDDEAERLKEAWRYANPWAKGFWDALRDASMAAMRTRGVWFEAGRVAFLFADGTLYCKLPCKRLITYPQARIEQVYKEKWDATVTVITYRKIWGSTAIRGELYGGFLAENVTQASAASLLRWAMRELDMLGAEIVLSTHDEVGVECDLAQVEDAEKQLLTVMETNPPWAPGLPLKAETKHGRYYRK